MGLKFKIRNLYNPILSFLQKYIINLLIYLNNSFSSKRQSSLGCHLKNLKIFRPRVFLAVEQLIFCAKKIFESQSRVTQSPGTKRKRGPRGDNFENFEFLKKLTIELQ